MSTSTAVRELGMVASEIVDELQRYRGAEEKWRGAQALKESTLQQISQAEGEHAALLRAREEESQNTGELFGLQRSNSVLNGRLQEMIKATKLARGKRDSAREAALGAYYLRRGVEVEALRASASSAGCRNVEVSGVAPTWSPRALALLAEVGQAWRKVSDASTLCKDVAEGCVQLVAGLTVEGEGGEITGPGSEHSSLHTSAAAAAAASPTLLAPTAGVVYSTLGLPPLLVDARRSLSGVKDLLEIIEGLRRKTLGGAGAGASAEGGEGEGEREGEREEEGEEDLSDDPDVTAALLAAIATLKLNLEAQQAILSGAVEAIEGHKEEGKET